MSNVFGIQVDGCSYTVNHTCFLVGGERIEVIGCDGISIAQATIDHNIENVDVAYCNETGHPNVSTTYNFSELAHKMDSKHHENVDLAKWLVATHPVNG